MTRAIVAALFTAIVILAFEAGRLSATPRPAVLAIPAATLSGAGEPDLGRTEAPVVRVGASPSPTAAASPQPTAVSSAASVSGIASWYRDQRRSGLYAAAGPDLRAFLGPRWRGKIVETCLANRPSACIATKLVDFCGCPGGRVIDLSPAAFGRLGHLSTGLLPVAVRLR